MHLPLPVTSTGPAFQSSKHMHIATVPFATQLSSLRNFLQSIGYFSSLPSHQPHEPTTTLPQSCPSRTPYTSFELLHASRRDSTRNFGLFDFSLGWPPIIRPASSLQQIACRLATRPFFTFPRTAYDVFGGPPLLSSDQVTHPRDDYFGRLLRPGCPISTLVSHQPYKGPA